MGVSACPRNCAESSIKDVGIIGVEGAWEIYVGGNGGATLKAAELLCIVSTDADVLDTIAAYLQYYRETARYLERTSHWLERVGLEHVKSVILDNKEERRELIKRMEIALDDLKDPWHEIIQNSQEQRDLFEKKAVPISSK